MSMKWVRSYPAVTLSICPETVDTVGFAPIGRDMPYEVIHHDNLQSVLGLSGHDGTVLQTISYDPFGNITSTTGSSNNNALHFTGREQDPDTGYIYDRARYYDPITGRFITEDPLGFKAGANFYVYALNNPINFNDPYGLDVTITINRDTYTSRSVTGTFSAYSDVTGNTVSGYTLETARNKAGLPPIDPGTYDAFIRRDHTPNRIELEGTDPRTNIQIHNANYPWQLTGCFAVGDSRGTDKVNNSINTLNQLLGLVNDDRSGNITVSVGPERDFDIPSQYAIPSAQQMATPINNNSSSFNMPDANMGSAAAGGYLIYPNKPNTNMMRSVYSK